MCAAALVRLVLPVLVISAFMNNSPVVLVLIPIITSWSRKAGLAPGHLFMPLSFASILGGTITLIGTSTNLVVAGKQRESFPEDPPITMFDLSPYGVPVALAGVIYIVILAPRLLPGKAKDASYAHMQCTFCLVKCLYISLRGINRRLAFCSRNQANACED